MSGWRTVGSQVFTFLGEGVVSTVVMKETRTAVENTNAGASVPAATRRSDASGLYCCWSATARRAHTSTPKRPA